MSAAYILRRACRALPGWSLLGILLWPMALDAAPAAPPASAPATLRDARLAMYARRALMQDDLLAPLNLGISVRQNVAIIWGPVPSQELAKRAVDRLREVKGLIEIRSQIYIAALEEPLPFKPPAHPPLMPLEPRQPPVPHPGDTLKFPRNALGTSLPSLTEPPSSRPLSESVALLPPVPRGTLTSGSAEASPSLPLAIEQVRLSDLRFRLARSEVQAGVVHLSGAVSRREDMLDLAERISRLPGVQRVILRDVLLEPRLGL